VRHQAGGFDDLKEGGRAGSVQDRGNRADAVDQESGDRIRVRRILLLTIPLILTLILTLASPMPSAQLKAREAIREVVSMAILREIKGPARAQLP